MAMLLLALLLGCRPPASSAVDPLDLLAPVPEGLVVWVADPGRACAVELTFWAPMTERVRGDAVIRMAEVEAPFTQGPAVSCTLYGSQEGWLWWVEVESGWTSLEMAIASGGRAPVVPDGAWGDTPPEDRRLRCALGEAHTPWIQIASPESPALHGQSVYLESADPAPPIERVLTASERCDKMAPPLAPDPR